MTTQSRIVALITLCAFAGGALYATGYWENVLASNAPAIARARAEYFATTWLTAFVICAAAAVGVLVNLVWRLRRTHDNDDFDNDDAGKVQR